MSRKESAPGIQWNHRAIAEHECPYCGASRGERCTTWSGDELPVAAVHEARWALVPKPIHAIRGLVALVRWVEGRR